MSKAFSFFLRLFFCFVAARFFLQAIGVAGRDWLVGLTLLFLVNVYWFGYLLFRDRTAPKVKGSPGQPQGAKAASSEGEEPSDPRRPGG